MLHILKIIHGYPTNYNAGSEVYSQSICNELSKHNRISVFTREENPYRPCFSIRHEIANDNLNFYFANNPIGKDGYRHKQMDDNFAKLIKELKPDIAHVGHLNHLSTGLVDELHKQNIPIVFTLHDFWLMCPRGQFLTRSIGKENNFELCSGQNDRKCAISCYSVYFSGREEYQESDISNWSNWVHNRMIETKSIVSKIDLFIAPSKYLRDRFVADFAIPKSKIILLDYGFPTEYLTTSEKSKDQPYYTFGYIGTHIPAKGVNMLIEAFKQISYPAKLLIWGHKDDQSSKALKLLSESSKFPVEFKGQYVNKNLADEVFSKVDCIVVPSVWAENSPLVIHEAQACKIPVITADYGGMKEYVQHKINGLLFEHRNIGSLTERLNFAVNNPDLMKTYGANGYIYSQDGSVPNIQDHCTELDKIYRSLTETNLWRLTIDTNPEDCNLKCLMCEEHSPYSDFIPKLFMETGIKRRRMKFETVEEIFYQAKGLGVKEIIPSTMGEPLLYKGIERIFELSERHGIKINLTTNGTFPKHPVEEWAKMIVPNTTDIKISWNGATAQTAEKIMIGLNFQQVIENVRSFVAFRNRHFGETGYYCKISFQLTFMQNNMQELADIIKLAAELDIDRVKGHQLWAHFDEIKNLSMKANSDNIVKWNEYVNQAYQAQESYRRPNGKMVILENIIPLHENDNIQVPENYECPFLGKELWISATGKISPCCAPDSLRKSLGDFGNIEDATIHDILNSTTYRELMRNYKAKPLCKTCNMRKPTTL